MLWTISNRVYCNLFVLKLNLMSITGFVAYGFERRNKGVHVF